MRKFTKWALASRIIILVIQLIANLALNDHHPDVFRSPVESPAPTLNERAGTLSRPPEEKFLDHLLQTMFGGLRHWDAEYFLHIAEHLYSYENSLAFYPLFPMIVRLLAHLLIFIGLDLTMRCMCLLVAVALNMFLFCKAANLLYQLTQTVFNDPNKAWYATLLFCFNPASIFFSAAYSESLFCFATFYLMRLYITDMHMEKTVLAISMSLLTRSNGLLNLGYPLYYGLRFLPQLRTLKERASFVFRLGACLVIALLPVVAFYYYVYQQFCNTSSTVTHSPAVRRYAHERNYVLAGSPESRRAPWCNATVPISYGYVQDHYWNVGFLRYYELRQIPNFLMAAPIIGFMGFSCLRYFRYVWHKVKVSDNGLLQTMRQMVMLPFVLHAAFLTAFCALCVHVQITTRMLCSASPVLYWFAADTIPNTVYNVKMRSKAGMVLLWFGGYYLVGTVLFANNYPWT